MHRLLDSFQCPFQVVQWQATLGDNSRRQAFKCAADLVDVNDVGIPDFRTRALRPCPFVTKPSAMRILSASRIETWATPYCRAQGPSTIFSPGTSPPQEFPRAIAPQCSLSASRVAQRRLLEDSCTQVWVMYHALAVILNRVELRIDETTVGYLGLATRVKKHSFPRVKCRGLDRLDANGTGVEELNRLVSEAFGDRSKMIIDAYRRDYPRATPFGLYATIAAAWVRRPAFEQAIRKAALRAAPAYSYVLFAHSSIGRPSWFIPRV